MKLPDKNFKTALINLFIGFWKRPEIKDEDFHQIHENACNSSTWEVEGGEVTVLVQLCYPESFQKQKGKGWRNGSDVTNRDCSSRELEFDF